MSEKMTGAPLDLAAVREKLARSSGRELWRGLEEVGETPEFREFLHREFPRGASELSLTSMQRRSFLKLMAASLGLAGLTGCGSPPREGIVPYVKQPEGIIPGKTTSYATATLLGGYATGVLVTSHTGRPTKVEGNPDHPASLGSTDTFAQASVLSLYDPDRAQTITSGGRIHTWSDFQNALSGALRAVGAVKGEGLRILTETITSPTLSALLGELLVQYPNARCHQWEPINRDRTREGARLAFGEPYTAQLRFEKADVVVALDHDFLGAGPGQVVNTRGYAARRRARKEESRLNRLYVVEATPSITGAAADHAWTLRPGLIGSVVQAIAQGLGMDVPAVDVARLFKGHDKWLAGLIADLQSDPITGQSRAPGTTLVTCGESQPPEVHALVHAINDRLGNRGATVVYSRPVEQTPAGPGVNAAQTHAQSLAELVTALKGKQVDLLVMLGGNPVYSAPAELDFAGALKQARLSVHLSGYRDETSELCHWHLPESHPLESWGDAAALDGTVTLIQPLTEPLYESKTALEVVSLLAGKAATAYDLLRDSWVNRDVGSDFEAFWQTTLNQGVVENSQAPIVKPPLAGSAWRGKAMPFTEVADGGFEVVFRPDPTMWDGRFANSGWLQELPKPLTRLTWDNAALIAPATAQRMRLANGDELRVTVDGRTVIAPVWILPGQPADVITLPLGYGRTRAGSVGSNTGFNAYALRTTAAPWSAVGVKVEVTGETQQLVSTQTHWSMEGRELVRTRTLADFQKFVQKPREEEELPTLYPGPAESPNQWALSVDLGACTGCNACVVACQAENNIPVIGKSEVARGRAMHWIRIDRYYEGTDIDSPDQTHHQPVMCMHCENAPCEVVCPVNATSHSEEGLNEQTYNRCVGTRYCSNNCPYKVRRFNFFEYTNQSSPTLKMLMNPEVTVRARGVMEKCSYCVQRIDRARTEAKIEGRPIRDGDVQTACQMVCPAQAIVFGNKNDKESAIARVKEEPHDYGILTELNTRPRTTYLAKVKNPNPKLDHA